MGVPEQKNFLRVPPTGSFVEAIRVFVCSYRTCRVQVLLVLCLCAKFAHHRSAVPGRCKRKRKQISSKNILIHPSCVLWLVNNKNKSHVPLLAWTRSPLWQNFHDLRGLRRFGVVSAPLNPKTQVWDWFAPLHLLVPLGIAPGLLTCLDWTLIALRHIVSRHWNLPVWANESRKRKIQMHRTLNLIPVLKHVRSGMLPL